MCNSFVCMWRGGRCFFLDVVLSLIIIIIWGREGATSSIDPSTCLFLSLPFHSESTDNNGKRRTADHCDDEDAAMTQFSCAFLFIFLSAFHHIFNNLYYIPMCSFFPSAKAPPLHTCIICVVLCRHSICPHIHTPLLTIAFG